MLTDALKTTYLIDGSTVRFTGSNGEQHVFNYKPHQDLKFECECGADLILCKFEILNTSIGPISIEIPRCKSCNDAAHRDRKSLTIEHHKEQADDGNVD